jgi:hypothetical protein
VARLAKEGREVAYVILTNSNKGSGNRSVTSEQLASIREEEQRRAAHVLSGTLSSSATRMVSWKIRASSGATLPAKSDGGGRTSSYGWARTHFTGVTGGRMYFP